MPNLSDQIARAFRDFVTDGIPSSGRYEVDKSEARKIGPLIEAAIGNVGLAGLVSARFATLSAANAGGASLAYAAGTVALIWNDPNDNNNDLAVKTGASGTGSWVVTTIIHDIMSGVAAPYLADAAGSASDAADSASSAAESAGFAEEFAGPVCASPTAGAAAVAVGQFFRVWNGDTPRTYTRYERTGTAPFYAIAAPLATTAALASTTPGTSGASLLFFESGQKADVLLSAGPIIFSREYGSGGGDEATQVAAMFTKMSVQRRPFMVDRPVSLSTLALINGYCAIMRDGDGLINVTGGSAGLQARESFTTVGSWTAAPTLVQFPSGSGSYISALPNVDSAAFAALSVGDYVNLSDSVWNRFQYINGDGVLVADGGSGVLTNQTNLSETAQVIGKAGSNTIYLDRVLGDWALYSSSGTIAKLVNNPCFIDVSMVGEISTVRDLVRLEGYVGADINAVIEGNSSRGVMGISLMGARIKAKVRDLRDDEGNSAFGYGVCLAAGSTDCTVDIHARNLRHGTSDIVMGTDNGLTEPTRFYGGVARRIKVTGVGISCTAATFDSHTFSDEVSYENISALGTHNTNSGQPASGLNCAVQVRGTNVRINGLYTNLQVGVRYAVNACRNSKLEISNFTHRSLIPDGASTTSANSILSFVGTRFSGSGSHEVNIRQSSIHNLSYAGKDWDFVKLHQTDVDMSTSTSGWPGNLFASCTASILGTTMTVSGPPTSVLQAGMELMSGAAAGTRIVKQLPGGTTGGAGDYEVSISQTVTSTTITAQQTGCMTLYSMCRVRDPVSMQIRCGLTFDFGKIIKGNNGNTFDLLDRAVLKARGHGFEFLNGLSSSGAAYAYSSITSGAVSFEYGNLWVSDARAEHSIKPFAYTGAGGTQTITVKSVELRSQYKGVQSRGDADASFRVGRDKKFQRIAGNISNNLTADRTFTLETLDADDGDEFICWHDAGGGRNAILKQGSTTLATLVQNQRGWFVFDGPNNKWRLTPKEP